MSGSPIYFSRSWCPSHLLIRVSRGHISQKYSPLYSGLFCRENYFEKRYLLMLFILPELLSVMNCSFLLLMLLLSQHIAGSPVSPCNLSCGACIFFPQGSYFYLYHLLLSCIALPPITSSACSRFGLALHMLMYTQDLCDCSSNVPSASDRILIKYAVSTHAVHMKGKSAEQQEQCQRKVSPTESILTTS